MHVYLKLYGRFLSDLGLEQPPFLEDPTCSQIHRSMAPGSIYSLNSTKTAIAIILPSAQSTDVNAIRSIHDKAYHKWPPHINILYPSVTAEKLKTALPLLRDAMSSGSGPILKIKSGGIDTFRHRHNATVFLEPDEQSKDTIIELRTALVKALGLSSKAGTLDGTFRPHLTLGQASLNGEAIESLVGKCSELTNLQWEIGELAVLSRKPSGEMEIIDHVSLGSTADTLSNDKVPLESQAAGPVWTPCFAFNSGGWQLHSGYLTDIVSAERPMSIVSYNLLADTFGCAFGSRLPLIIEALKDVSRPNMEQIWCLQEVSNTMIIEILAHPFIQQHYPYSSHSPTSLLANYLNLVTLSTTAFTFRSHQFEERHKSALLVRPQLLPFEVANVHLTAALKDHTVAAKQRQLASLTAYFNQPTQDPERHAIIAGDFNLASSGSTIRQALRKGDINFNTSVIATTLIDPDTWADAYLSSPDMGGEVDGDGGATFDVQRNPLAAESNAPADQSPQRYDRILFRKSSTVHVHNFKIFGYPDDSGQCGSDHFGIVALLRPRRPGLDSPSVLHRSSIDLVMAGKGIDIVRTNLRSFMPSDSDRAKRALAMTRLQRILTSDARLIGTRLFPLGSYALDTFFAESDVDVLVMGPLRPAAFFNIASSRLAASADAVHELHYINSLVPVLETQISGIKFDVQYCHAPELLSRIGAADKDAITNLLSDDASLAGLNPGVLRPLNTFRDAAYILKSLLCLDAFRLAYRFLSLYLRRRGLYSAKFGYLGGVHLTLMLNHVIKHVAVEEQYSITPEVLVASFLRYYAKFPWSSAVLCDPSFPHPDYRRTSREPVVILALHSPTARLNVASSCTRLSAETIAREFDLADVRLSAGDWRWMLRGQAEVFVDFMKRFGGFIVITIDMWKLDRLEEKSRRAFVGYIESRVPVIMVQLSRIENLYAQAWPAALTSVDDEVEDDKQFNAIYAIGIAGPTDQNASSRKLIQSKVLELARSFETMLKASEYYDDKCMWCQVELKSRKKLSDLRLAWNE